MYLSLLKIFPYVVVGGGRGLGDTVHWLSFAEQNGTSFVEPEVENQTLVKQRNLRNRWAALCVQDHQNSPKPDGATIS
jgi:hypothetical protein